VEDEEEEEEEVVAVLRWLSETLPGRHLYNAEQELDCELMILCTSRPIT